MLSWKYYISQSKDAQNYLRERRLKESMFIPFLISSFNWFLMLLIAQKKNINGLCAVNVVENVVSNKWSFCLPCDCGYFKKR